ncbi:MAG: acyl carrier protein [Gammaproteobacteria bacterium]|nr:acyl carrier protein [Gammaproteobacteria bacterium]MBT6479897.1 acyl carrier protein [Gammaproteobacteria bacterium]MBT6652775.1 acyl carrier protein [Gammaproteobacteria bacterium]MBT7327042.1 acyl carrier protein [Gammaproteobacteria bacterium]
MDCEKIREIVVSAKVLNVEVGLQDELLNSGIIDSFSIMTISEEIRQQFQVELQFEGSIRDVFSTIEQLCQFVEKNLQRQADSEP